MTSGPSDRTRVKCCGLRTPADVAAVVAAGADAIGFVLAEGSPRTVNLETLERLLEHVPPAVAAVVVLRDQSDLPGVRAGVVAQLHGDEDEEACREAARRTGRPVIRGFAFDPERIRRWDACPDVGVLLVDAAEPGSGAAFDHDALAEVMPSLRTPVALAGGLGPENVADAVARVRPFMVDASSGLEARRGVKDPARIAAFAAAVRAADADLDRAGDPVS